MSCIWASSPIVDAAVWGTSCDIDVRVDRNLHVLKRTGNLVGRTYKRGVSQAKTAPVADIVVSVKVARNSICHVPGFGDLNRMYKRSEDKMPV
jgi:hypothetical protein